VIVDGYRENLPIKLSNSANKGELEGIPLYNSSLSLISGYLFDYYREEFPIMLVFVDDLG